MCLFCLDSACRIKISLIPKREDEFASVRVETRSSLCDAQMNFFTMADIASNKTNPCVKALHAQFYRPTAQTAGRCCVSKEWPQ
jgi:hypothetical protein